MHRWLLIATAFALLTPSVPTPAPRSELTDLLHRVHDESVSVADRREACRTLADHADDANARVIAHSLAGVAARSDEPSVRLEVCEALFRFRRHLPELVPLLSETLWRNEANGERGGLSWRLIQLVGRTGVDGVPALIAALQLRGEGRHAAECLGDLGPLARPAIPALRCRLKNDDPQMRTAAASALLRIDRTGQTPVVVAMLCQMFAEQDEQHREVGTVYALLGWLGADAAPVVPLIRERLRQKPPVDERLLTLLSAIGPAAADAEPELRTILEENPSARIGAATALWRVCLSDVGLEVLLREAERNEHALSLLCDFAKPDPKLWRRLCELFHAAPELRSGWVLARVIARTASVEEAGGLRFDGRREVARMFLERLREHPDQTADLLGVADELGPDGAELVPTLRSALDDADLRYSAVAGLAAIGPAARSALPRLWQLARVSGDHDALSGAAAVAVACIDSSNADEAVRLLCQLPHPSPEHLAEPLTRLGPRAKAALPLLRSMLGSADPVLFRMACRLMWAIDADEARRLGVVDVPPNTPFVVDFPTGIGPTDPRDEGKACTAGS